MLPTDHGRSGTRCSLLGVYSQEHGLTVLPNAWKFMTSPLPREELGLLLASRGGVYPVTLYLPPLTYFTLK